MSHDVSLTGTLGFADRPERYQFTIEVSSITEDVTMTVETGDDRDGGQIISIQGDETAWAFATIAQGILALTDRVDAQNRPQEAA